MAIKSKPLHVVVCLLLVILLGPRGSAQTTEPSIFINEIHYDNTGTDAGEFIEIAGPAGTNLSGYAIELYNGNGGARYDVDPLSGVIPDQQNGFGTVSISYPSNGIQNGSPDGIALVNGSTVIQFLSYEGPFTAVGSTANGMTSTDIGVRQSGSNALGTSLQLQGTGSTYGDFTWTVTPITNTQNAVNTGQTFSDDDPPPTPVLEIHEIQGSGAGSPFAGQLVKTLDNIVTARATNGFFMQAPPARVDGFAETSEGIFVFTSSAPTVQVGDQVDVTATVQEFFTLTELASPTVTIDSSGEALPAPVMFGPSLPSPIPPGNLEPLEGMLVRVENAMVTGPTDGFGDTAVVAGATRTFREPGIEYPGLPGYATTWDGNPEIFEINADGAGLANASFVAGAIIDVAEGPLHFSFGDYQIWPTTLAYSAEQPEVLRPVRARVAGEMTVGSQNMLRLFDTVNDAGVSDEVIPPLVFDNRIAKASLYVRTVLGSPDVVVLEEVENLGVANALASRLVADDPTLGYTAHLLEGNDIGGIDIAMLVRSTVLVTSITQLGKDERYTFNGAEAVLHDRPPLVLRGRYIGNGAPFPITVIGVHNRSLNGIDDSSDGPRVRTKRLAQALSIARYVQDIQESEPNRRIIITGDFNAFQFSDGYVDALGVITGNLDPAGAIQAGHQDMVDPNLTNQVMTVSSEDRYSYVFLGNAQVLDHTLTTANLQPFVRGFQYSRANADVPGSLRNTPSTPLALSDHDGAVLFVMTDRDADGLADDDDACQASSNTFVTVGTCTTTVPDQIFTNGCSITDTLANLAATSTNHGEFVSQATHWLTELRRNGVVDNKQRSEIVSCATKQ